MITYLTISGDTWDMISYKVYQSEYYVDELMRANPQFVNIAIFSSGVTLVIPEIITQSTIKLPPWK